MDLDSLPYADWDSLPMDKYFAQVSAKKNYVKFFGSRGCPFQCIFCAAPLIMGRKLRKRSPENIVGELILLYDKFSVRDVGFGDSTLNVDNKWLTSLCKEIIKMNRPIIWRCNVRGRGVNKEVAQLMKKSGCVHVTMGIESGDPEMLKAMKKGETLHDFRKAIKVFHDLDIPLVNSFIIGLPGETEESIKRTLEFAKEIKTSVAGFNIAVPFPGTEFYEIAKKEGVMVDDWTKFNVTEVSYIPKGMTQKPLQDAFRWVSKKYYLRLMYLFQTLMGVKSFLNLKIFLRAGFRVLQKNLNIRTKILN